MKWWRPGQIIESFWNNVRAFYRQFFQLMLARQHNFEGSLEDFVMKRGYLWDFLEWHLKLVVSLFMVVLNSAQLVLAYVGVSLVLVFFLISPILLLTLFPFHLARVQWKLYKAAKDL